MLTSATMASDREVFLPCAAAALYRSSVLPEVDGFVVILFAPVLSIIS